MDWLSIGGSVLGAVSNLWSANNANDAQMRNIENQMAFNREVMQNRHQWEVQDLRQAGLNPLMSVTSPTGTLSAPSAPVAHKADIASSALALGQLQIADKQAEAQLISAKASAKNAETAFKAMENESVNISSQVRAREVQNETSWLQVNSMVENAKSQTDLNKAQTVKTQLENIYLPKMYEANLNEIQQRIANSILEVSAKVTLMDRQGRAALTNAAAQTMIANTLEANGVSLRELQSAQVEQIGQKMGIDLLQSSLDAEKKQLGIDRQKFDNQNFFSNGFEGYFYRGTDYFGKQISNVLGLTTLMTPFAK